jgi:tetratricopeptide (TPR) repeat protein
MYVEKTRKISLENLMEKYEKVTAKLTSEQQKSTKNKAAIDTFLKNINILVEKEATCETLIPMYQKKFKSYATDVDWLRKAAGRLDAKGCKEDPLFVELVEAIDNNAPNADSKLYLWKIHERLGNSAKAKTYFEAYLTLETDGEKKANVLHGEALKAAKIKQKSKARSLFLEALTANPNAGKIYLNLARLYATSANECGTDEFTKRAIYWKAAETARKAASADSSVRSEANKLVETYMQSAPSKIDIFKKTYKGGEKIPLKCWVGGFVTVPKL